MVLRNREPLCGLSNATSPPTIQRLELQRGTLKANYRTISKLVVALKQAGVVFTERGVELVAKDEDGGLEE